MAKLVGVIAISCTIIVVLGSAPLITAKIYTVGDDAGWGPGNDYSLWLQGKTFHKGDVLVFHYGEGYSVDEVTAKKFKACDPTNSKFSATDGNTKIHLKKTGVHYFIGGAFNECPQGMNLTVIVH